MHEMKCQTCGAECAVGTSFCRQCGAPVSAQQTQVGSEQTTALLDQTDSAATQHFEPRATGPERGRLPTTPTADYPIAAASKRRVASRLGILIGALVIIVFICVLTFMGLRGHSRNSGELIYPGAKTLLDMTNEGGGRALHLETSDPLDKVERWYTTTLQPQKTVRLTSSSVVLKNEKITATIAAEGSKTSILIKAVP
jgi:hypothetical protein